MAKKRRREEAAPEETYEFRPPEFDEREFLLKDLYGTKVLMIAAALAIVAGIIARFIGEIHFAVGLLFLFLVIFGFKHILALMKFRVDLMEQKMLIGNYILFLFLSLGIWIILMNPPF